MKRFGAAVLSIIMSFMMAAAVLPETAAAEEEAYRYGTVTLYSTYAPGETLTDGFYYTDSWFFEDPAVRNDSLALVSIQLTAAAADGEGGCGTDFLSDLGFEESGCYGFETDDPDGAGYTWGKKEISSDGESFTLIAVAMQSYSLDKAAKKRAEKITPELIAKYPQFHFAWLNEFIEVTPKGCSKATGLSKYLDSVQSREDNVLVIGDSGNDVPMFEAYYEQSFCMSHSPASVKSHAKHIVESFSDLEKYLCPLEDSNL